MDLGLTGKRAVVTGGSKGIGMAVAAELLAEGAQVAICARHLDELDSAADVLRNAAPADSHPLLDAIVDATARVCSPRVGFDCQVANWLWDGATATHGHAHAALAQHGTHLRVLLRRQARHLVIHLPDQQGSSAARSA